MSRRSRRSAFLGSAARNSVPRWSVLFGAAPTTHNLPITQRVLLDIDATCNGVEISGTGELVFDPAAPRTLTVDNHTVMVMDGGKLTMRPDSPSIVHKLRFINVDESQFTSGGDIETIDHHANPGLMVMDATVTLQGSEKTGWTRATHALLSGATTCTVVDATGWQIGDEIVITPTEASTVASQWTHFDRRTLTNVVGNTITFAACSFPHPTNTSPSGVVIGAEVLNLSRNVIIEGQDASHRAHTMFMGDITDSTFTHFEGRFLGPRQASEVVLGRYALHFHRAGEGTRDLDVTGVSMHDCGSRGFVPHGSHGMTFYDCVAWDVFAQGYWWDINPGDELIDETNDLLYDKCFAGRIRDDAGGAGDSGFFMSAGVNITARNCCTAGLMNIGYHWPESLNGNEHNFWIFEDNDSHNTSESGIFIWQNDGNPHVLTRYRGWNNDLTGMDFGAYVNVYQFEDMELWGNNVAGVGARSDFRYHPNTHLNSPRRIEIRGGYTGYLRIMSHRLSTATYALFINTEIEAAAISETQAEEFGLIDFVDCGITAADFAIQSPQRVMHTGSIYRVQQDLTAQKIVSLDGTTLTVTNIELFHGMRGVVLNGGEFGAGVNISTGSGGTFSNVNRGTYGTDYQYDSQTSLNYLASRGVQFVRLMFRWERLQPTLSAALDTTEAGRIDSVLTRIAAAGMKAILTPSNYGAYWLDSGGVGVRRAIGSAQVSQAAFVDFWTRVSARYKTNSTVAAYALDSEPTNMANAAAWEAASQAALTAIRANSDTKRIIVPTYNFSSMTVLETEHPNGPWITHATAGDYAYDCHQYPGTFAGDVEGGGISYAAANADAVSRGYDNLLDFELTARAEAFHTWLAGRTGFVGEIGWPNQDVRPTDYTQWNTVAAALLDYYNSRGWGWLVWGAGEFWGSTYIYSAYSATGAATLNSAESSASILESRLEPF